MFDGMKIRAQRTMLKVCVMLIAGFFMEHAAGAVALKTGIIQGHIVMPTISFGGYDAAKEQQLAMLGDAIPAVAMKPIPDKLPAIAAKAVLVPARKPEVR